MYRHSAPSNVWRSMVVVLLVAAAVRIVGISFGNPDPRYVPTTTSQNMLHEQTPLHPDEFLFVAHPLQMLLSGDLTPGFYENPSFLLNLNFFTQLITGSGEGVPHAVRAGGRNLREYAPFELYVVGRMYSVLGGMLSVAAAFAIVRRLASWRAALLAGALVAVAFPLVQHAHYVVTSSLATGFLTLCMFFSLAAIQSRQNGGGLLLLAGLCAGLAMGNRYNAAVGSLFVLLAGFVLLAQKPHPRTLLVIAPGYLAFPLVFLFTTPFIFVDFEKFVIDLESISSQYLGVASFSPWMGLWLEYQYLLVFGIGIPAMVFALIGVISALRGRCGWYGLMLIAYVAVYSLLILRTIRPSGADQLLLPVIPAFAVLAGIGADYLVRRYRSALAFTGLLLCLLAMPAYHSLAFLSNITQDDTREQMQAWVTDHLPHGSRILLVSAINVPLDAAFFDWSQAFTTVVRTSAEQWQGVDYVILSDARLLKDVVAPDVERAADENDLANVPEGVDVSEAELLLALPRPHWYGTNWGLHTASYWHQPGLRLYCLHSVSCKAINID